MFQFDPYKNFVLGALAACVMVGCQGTNNSLYEDMDVEQVSLETYLEEQDGSLEEWEAKEKQVAKKIAAGEYELSDVGLLADTGDETFFDPMAGAMGDWGEAPEEIAEVEGDSTLIHDDETAATVAAAETRLGKLAAGKDPEQESTPVLAGEESEETPGEERKEDASLPEIEDVLLEDVPVEAATRVESEKFTQTQAVDVESEALGLQDLDEDSSIALLMGDDESTDLDEDVLDAGGEEDFADPAPTLFANDAASLADGTTVSEGLYVTIREPRRLAARDGEGARLAEQAQEQGAFLTSLIGETRDVEAWDEEEPTAQPEFFFDDMELVAFDLPEKMDAELEDLAIDTYSKELQQTLAVQEPTSVEVPASAADETPAIMVATLDSSPYAGIATRLEDSNGDIDYDAFISAEADASEIPEPAAPWAEVLVASAAPEPTAEFVEASQPARRGIPERVPQRRVRKSAGKQLQVLAAKQAERRLATMVASVHVEEPVEQPRIAQLGEGMAEAPVTLSAAPVTLSAAPVTLSVSEEPRRILMASSSSLPVLEGRFVDSFVRRKAPRVIPGAVADVLISVMDKPVEKLRVAQLDGGVSEEPQPVRFERRRLVKTVTTKQRPDLLADNMARHDSQEIRQREAYPSTQHPFRPIKEVPFKEQEANDTVTKVWRDRRLELIIPKRLRIETV